MEQLPFNYEEPKRPEDMTDAELEDAYRKHFRISPRSYMTRDAIIDAVNNPNAEMNRLFEEEREENEADLMRDSRRG